MTTIKITKKTKHKNPIHKIQEGDFKNMLRLKELEALTEISAKVDKLTIHNGTSGLMNDLVRLGEEGQDKGEV